MALAGKSIGPGNEGMGLALKGGGGRDLRLRPSLPGLMVGQLVVGQLGADTGADPGRGAPPPADGWTETAADARGGGGGGGADPGPRPPTVLPDFNVPGWVRLHTLVLIRWIALLAQTMTLGVVYLGMEIDLPMAACLGVITLSALFNLLISVGQRRGSRLGDLAASLYLALDLLQLSAMLYLTGGLSNPFALLILAPIAVSASILSRRSILGLSLLAILLVSGLVVWHLPFPLPAEQEGSAALYLLGVWVSLTIGIVFLATYIWHVTKDARRLSDALARTQMALAREQHLSSLGALAAAMAHELGTPLSTIAMVAKEIEHGLEKDSPLAEDAAVLVSQAERCRDILANLSRHPDAEQDSFILLPLSAMVEEAAKPHESERVAIEIKRLPQGAEAGPEPRASAVPEISHAISTLIENGAQFAASSVKIAIQWDQETACIHIEDDGPGFPAAVLDRLGEPYLSGRKSKHGHLGLGIFIAQTLLHRTGARLRFENIAPYGSPSPTAPAPELSTEEASDSDSSSASSSTSASSSSASASSTRPRKNGARIVITWQRYTFENIQKGVSQHEEAYTNREA